MTSREWLLKELSFTESELYSNRRDALFTNKRWVMIWFYHKLGLKGGQIKQKLGRDRASIRHALIHISPILKGLAEELLHRYITEVLHETPDFMVEKVEPETEIVKQPDYLHSRVIEKEVVKQPKKPIERVSKWNL